MTINIAQIKDKNSYTLWEVQDQDKDNLVIAKCVRKTNTNSKTERNLGTLTSKIDLNLSLDKFNNRLILETWSNKYYKRFVQKFKDKYILYPFNHNDLKNKDTKKIYLLSRTTFDKGLIMKQFTEDIIEFEKTFKNGEDIKFIINNDLDKFDLVNEFVHLSNNFQTIMDHIEMLVWTKNYLINNIESYTDGNYGCYNYQDVVCAILDIDTIFSLSKIFDIHENKFYDKFEDFNILMANKEMQNTLKTNPNKLELRHLVTYHQHYHNFYHILQQDFVIFDCIDLMMSYHEDFFQTLHKNSRIEQMMFKYEYIENLENYTE